MKRLAKNNKSQPPPDLLRRSALSVLRSYPPTYRLQWSNDDKVWLILLNLLYHTASQKAMPGSTGPSTEFILSKAEGLRTGSPRALHSG
jgi:hypothetical protein